MSKASKKASGAVHKEPYWVLHNWDNIIRFMMCGTTLNWNVHTAVDLSDSIPQWIGSYPCTQLNKGKSGSSAPQTIPNTTFTIESATKQGILSQQQEGDTHMDRRENRIDQLG